MIRLEIQDQLFNQKNLIFRRELVPVRERIIQQIEKTVAETVFYYDFCEIEAVNSSGCDELIAKVILELIKTDPPKYLILCNLSEEYEHAWEVDSALKKREVSVVHLRKDGNIDFIGKVSDAHREILECVYRNKDVTARELSDALNKKLTLISTQLSQLFKARLIRREEDWLIEGGRQYRYLSLI